MSGHHDNQSHASPPSSQASASPRPWELEANGVNLGSSIKEWEPEHPRRHTSPATHPSSPSLDLNGNHGIRKQRAPRSGGFLLQELIPSIRNRPPHRIFDEQKGKGKATNDDDVYLKRMLDRRHSQKPSVGSSPLSTVLYSNADKAGSPVPRTRETDQHPSSHPEPTLQERGAYPIASSNGRASPEPARYRDAQTPSGIGHDTDPAQIVNLALNLSESRRRNISGGRVSPAYIHGARRRVPSEPNDGGSPARHVSTAGANLRKYLDDQRRVSRTLASKSASGSWENSSPKSARSSNGGDPTFASELYDSTTADGVILKPSEATLARAEKARVFFELSYEYRRLLQYLPRLPRSTKDRPTSAKANKGSNALDAIPSGRVYDPLQYIRNRKVRGRGGKHLDAEVNGWKDPDRVKLWVDQIADEYEGPEALVDDKKLLPSFDSIRIDPQVSQAPTNSNGASTSNTRPAKSERQISGWRFTPWDLLADAAWLDQDNNFSLIEDLWGKKLFPQPQVPRHTTPRTSIEQARPPSKRSLSVSQSVVPDEQLSVEGPSRKEKKRDLSRIRGAAYETGSPIKDHEVPRQRKGRWHRNFIRSRSPSSSDDSLTDGAMGYAWSRHHDREGLDSVALEKQMMELLAKENESDLSVRLTEQMHAAKEMPREMNDRNEVRQAQQITTSQEETLQTPKKKSRLNSFHEPLKTTESCVEEERGRQLRSSDELPNDVPKTPSTFHFGPSIFVNQSAQDSRSVSPKRPFTSRLMPLRHNRSQSRQSVSDIDLAANTGSPVRSARQHARDLDYGEARQGMQKSNSSSNLLSPATAELFGKRFRRLSNSSPSAKVERESRDPESRFRGLLRGTRIAELVGSEVSRVGDMIWRREGGNISQNASPISARGIGDSDTEGEYSTFPNSPETDLSRVTTSNEDGGTLSLKPTRNSQPTYHHPNLPTFRSSTVTQASPGSPKTSSPEDHPITRQQMAQKAHGRSSRFDRLAPPKIDMRSVSPSASPPLSRFQTSNTDNVSRETSTSRSNHRVRSADRRLNDVLGVPGTVRNVVGPTGLANLSSSTTTKRHTSSSRPPLGDRGWSISDRSVSNTRGSTITKRDIARVRALLLSSGIKANEIARQANTVDDPPFLSQLRELHERLEKPVPRVPRAQEHLLTAKLIVAEIDRTNQAIRDGAEAFSTETVEALHGRFKDVDDRVAGDLIPRVRASADDADALSMELTTTQTLAVKRLGDGVEALLRRRGRKGRLVRRGGYVVLEWMLLGIMWMVWLVVVVVRLIESCIEVDAMTDSEQSMLVVWIIIEDLQLPGPRM
ncbi:MAG: hypothetical protein Q9219_005416 [cf. Caloplaca sp. 3 TL-2023]